MNIKDIIVPNMGESISEATVLSIRKKIGDSISDKDSIFELETDKINVEVNAESSGIIKEILVKEGDIIGPNSILARYEEGEIKPSNEANQNLNKQEKKEEKTELKENKKDESIRMSPSASHIIQNDSKINPNNINPSAKNGNVLTKFDIINNNIKDKKDSHVNQSSSSDSIYGEINIVKMTGLRKTIARRLKEAQNTAAMLTTFNEVDMTNASLLRKKYQEAFQKKYDIKLGFMSIFTRAAVLALAEFPAVNAEISGDNIIYKNFYNIGVAIGSEKGLVVPILKNVERLGMHEIEIEISKYAKKVKNNELKPSDFEHGTFTISNGGVYGSLMSTPIINPPQSAILGMHSIVDRPIAVNNEVKIRPMMYLALSYDHRIIDGKEAVSFLKKIKEYVEDPERMILFV